VAGFCEYGDEPSGSGATELVSYEGKRPHGRPKRRCQDNVKTDVSKIGIIWL
jgi:hypothetical protein